MTPQDTYNAALRLAWTKAARAFLAAAAMLLLLSPLAQAQQDCRAQPGTDLACRPSGAGLDTARGKHSLTLPVLFYAAGATLDMASTADCLHIGCREQNPLINWLEPHGAAPMLAFGAAVEVTAVVALNHFIGPKHPRLVRAGLYAAGSLHLVYGLHNISEARGQRAGNARRLQ